MRLAVSGEYAANYGHFEPKRGSCVLTFSDFQNVNFPQQAVLVLNFVSLVTIFNFVTLGKKDLLLALASSRAARPPRTRNDVAAAAAGSPVTHLSRCWMWHVLGLDGWW